MSTEIKKNADIKMQKSIDKLKNDLSKIRTGRAHTGILDHIMIDYYGSPTPLNQVASIALADARTITVSPWEKPLTPIIEKAIGRAGLGLNPVGEGAIIRIPMPPLSEERRRDLVKVIKNEAESARVAIRNVRRDANQALKEAVKDKVISEDDEKRGEAENQKLTNAYIEIIDKMFVEKEKELMTV